MRQDLSLYYAENGPRGSQIWARGLYLVTARTSVTFFFQSGGAAGLVCDWTVRRAGLLFLRIPSAAEAATDPGYAIFQNSQRCDGNG